MMLNDEVSCINFICHVVQYVLIESVGEDHVALCLELVEVVDDFAAEDFASVFECRLINDDWNSLNSESPI